MKKRVIAFVFFIPVLFSGNSPVPEPPTKPVIEKLEQVNQKMIDLTEFIKNEKAH